MSQQILRSVNQRISEVDEIAGLRTKCLNQNHIEHLVGFTQFA